MQFNLKEEPEKYRENNNLQRSCTREILKEFADNIKWKNGAKILDIGSGDGSVTVEIFEKFIPVDYETLIGCDISEVMVDSARKKYANGRIDFIVQDITGDIAEKLVENFDHAFSTFTLHWTKQINRVFSNIHKLLAPGGDCLLLILGSVCVFNEIRELSQQDKWRSIFYNCEEFIPIYHELADSKTVISQFLKDAGFKEVNVTSYSYKFEFDNFEKYADFVYLVTPAAYKLTDDEYEDFKQDLLKVCSKKEPISASEPYELNFEVNVVYGQRRCA